MVSQPTQAQTDDNNILSAPLNSQVSPIIEFQQLQQAMIDNGEEVPDPTLSSFISAQDAEILRSSMTSSVHRNLVQMSVLEIEELIQFDPLAAPSGAPQQQPSIDNAPSVQAARTSTETEKDDDEGNVNQDDAPQTEIDQRSS